MNDSNLEPLNTEWNRKTGILTGNGVATLLGTKHGISYFTWTDKNQSVLYLQCDEGVLKKHFRISLGTSSQENLDALVGQKIRFVKYPFEVIK